MNPDLDPLRHEPDTTPAKKNEPVVQRPQENIVPVKPKTLPDFLNTLVKPDTISGDLCRYFVFPAIETGIHKVATAVIGHFILGQPIKPSNAKNNGVYIYNDQKNTDYTQYSSGRTQATIINSNGLSQSISSEGKYNGSTQSVFKLQKFAEDDVLHNNPLIWSWADVEAKRDYMYDTLSEIIYDTGGVTVQDVADTAGIVGIASNANKWWWTSLAKMSVQLDPDDSTILVIRMGMPPVPVKQSK